MTRRLLISAAGLALAWLCHAEIRAADATKPAFKAGVATRVITPPEPMWMAGYGGRTKPAEGKRHDLFVKVLAVEDAQGGKLVLLTSDLVGIPRNLSDQVAEEIGRRTGLARERLMLTCSHTHCGPVVRDNLADMYPMSPEEAKKIGPYTEKLRGWMVEAIAAALADLKPARLAIGQGTARFAVNRREPTAKGVINGFNPSGSCASQRPSASCARSSLAMPAITRP
jgi:neutral ceramidase